MLRIYMNVKLPISKDDKDYGKRTLYAPYIKIIRIVELCRKNPDKIGILFLDEINRAENAVIAECMNLILNREINGLTLPDNCRLIAAMNPADEDGNCNYSVSTMDAAAMDRFVYLKMESSLTDWIDWGTSLNNNNSENNEKVEELLPVTEEEKLTKINKKIVEFLAQPQFKNFLNITPSDANPITPSPRSWNAFSDIYYVYNKNKKIIEKKILLEVAKGCLGTNVASEFIKFDNENVTPIMSTEMFFNDKKKKEVQEALSEESVLRIRLIFKNALNDIMEQSKNKELEKIFNNKKQEIFIGNLLSIPKDSMVSIMKTIKRDYDEINTLLLDNEDYLDAFYNEFKKVNE